MRGRSQSQQWGGSGSPGLRHVPRVGATDWVGAGSKGGSRALTSAWAEASLVQQGEYPERSGSRGRWQLQAWCPWALLT